ncbi:MAG: prephenate dehydratase [Dehalococcoidales bacterium]|nr:prephenate dehydratase [Dehalococcoidales bacterium]
MSLEDLRKRIDKTDAEIVKLISERIRIAREIGKEKIREGKQINDRAREKKVSEHIKRMARSENMDQEVIESIYQQIMTACRRTQGVEVAFPGEPGAYSEEAALKFFGPLAMTKPQESLEGVFRAVEQDEVQFGIAPIENSLEGTIGRSYDLLLTSSLKVCGELELHVTHCLVVNPETRLDAVKKVYSHPQALGQCRTFLKQLGCRLVPTSDTATSVKMIKEKCLTDAGAIASARAAEIYQMKILAREIEDNPSNFTRFFILAKEDCPPSGEDKTSIVFSVKNKPMALYELLNKFASKGVNLTKIESRPTRQKAWEYNFYLDFEGHREDKAPKEVLANLEEATLFLRVLGSYPKTN